MRFFRAWEQYLGRYFPGISTNLNEYSTSKQIETLAAYARHVKEGGLSDRKGNVQSQTVAVALRAISTTLQLDGKPNPLEEKKGKYPKAISQLLESYRRLDKPTIPKLDIPVKVVNFIRRSAEQSTDIKYVTASQLCVIAFYYLLRVGEYTYHRPSENRRTKQFRVCDITF